jgi:hypothetical protein
LATRFKISLAHAGCDHAGPVVWEERSRTDASGRSDPAVVSLPRGFVSLNGEDGSIEIMCMGCRQTVASAVCSSDPETGAVADSNAADVPADAVMETLVEHDEASDTAIFTDHASNGIASERFATASDDKMQADLMALFDESEDVAPIRGDAIPRNLFDRLHNLTDRLRHRSD